MSVKRGVVNEMHVRLLAAFAVAVNEKQRHDGRSLESDVFQLFGPPDCVDGFD